MTVTATVYREHHSTSEKFCECSDERTARQIAAALETSNLHYAVVTNRSY